MRYEKVRIESFGYELPENIVTSASLEDRLSPVYSKLNLPYGRLERATGIRERRMWGNGTRPSEASAKAAQKAIARSGINKDEIECLLHASVSRDFLEPATATVVHHSLGLPPTATIFDISNACLGFINGIVTLANMIELGQVKAGIVVGAEDSSRAIDKAIDELLNDPDITKAKLKSSFATLTLGCGAVAVVLTRSSMSPGGHRLLGGAVRTASQYNDLCRIEPDTYFFDFDSEPNMRTDYRAILKNGLMLAPVTWKALQQELGWNGSDVDKVFTHQVSAVHRKLFLDVMGIDESKDFPTVEYLGNIASVSLPISLAIGIDKGHVHSGDKIVMMGGGSGLCSIMLGLVW